MKKIRMLIVLFLIIATALSFAACMDGLDGKNGTNGLSAYELYVKYYPDYEGDEEQWVNDLADGNLVRFTVTFVSNGGSQVEPLLKVRKGTLIQEPYVFHEKYENVDWYKVEGWYEDSDFNDKWDFDTDKVKSDITLYAKWPAPTEGLEFETINGGMEYAVTGIGVATDEHIVIPSEYDGLPITAIGNGAFVYCASLTSIIIPDSVTTIGVHAFVGCKNITSITIGNSVTTIGDQAFVGCENITSITIGNSVTTIGNGAFVGCENITSIIIPDSVTTIGNQAFADCISLTSIIIPDSVTTIGNQAFVYCGNLQVIHVKSYAEKPDGWRIYWKDGCNATVEWDCQCDE